jgi:hypothetical protein
VPGRKLLHVCDLWWAILNKEQVSGQETIPSYLLKYRFCNVCLQMLYHCAISQAPLLFLVCLCFIYGKLYRFICKCDRKLFLKNKLKQKSELT